MEYVASFAFYILDSTDVLGIPFWAESRQSKQSELFQLLIPRHFINCSYPRNDGYLDSRISFISRGDTILHHVVRNNIGEDRRSKVAFLLQHGVNLNAVIR